MPTGLPSDVVFCDACCRHHYQVEHEVCRIRQSRERALLTLPIAALPGDSLGEPTWFGAAVACLTIIAELAFAGWALFEVLR